MTDEMSERAKSPKSISKRKNTYGVIKHQQGKNNSQYGTMWITNGEVNKKISKFDIIPDGWYNGRI